MTFFKSFTVGRQIVEWIGTSTADKKLTPVEIAEMVEIISKALGVKLTIDLGK